MNGGDLQLASCINSIRGKKKQKEKINWYKVLLNDSAIQLNGLCLHIV